MTAAQLFKKIIRFLKVIKRQFNPLRFIKSIIPSIQLMVKHGIPAYILYFGDSLGDNLLLTTLATELNRRGYKNVWIKSDREELFANNPYIKLVVPLSTTFSTLLMTVLRIRLVHPTYTVYECTTDKDTIPEKHIILKMADCVGLKGEITVQPYLFLTDEELKFGAYAKKQVVITTSNSSAGVYMRNKEWYANRYQQIADDLSKEFLIIQLGSKGDTPLNNALDLRGKTTLRESASILRNSTLLISHVGFMMHLARAVECPSVIIYGGRERPDQSGYAAFNNIYVQLACSPCWQLNLCHYNKLCMDLITGDVVKNAIYQELGKAQKMLVKDVLVND
jgi:ADP-heptose:LPS heptosyltransferase